MKSEEIKRLVAKSENAAVEFKRARGGVPADFWPSYSSFANTDGGVIILGVREKDGKCEIEGLANTEKIVADLWNAVNNPDKISANVLFNESIYPVDVDGKAVVFVEVPRAARTVRPVFVGSDVFKGTYRRNGEGDYHCSRETVEGMIRGKCAERSCDRSARIEEVGNQRIPERRGVRPLQSARRRGDFARGKAA